MRFETVLAMAAALGIWAGSVHAGDPAAKQAAGPAMNVTAGEIAKNPANYTGKLVTVKAEAEDVYNDHFFTLDEDAIGAGPDVLVLVPAPVKAVTDDDDLTVTGTVRTFVRADLERDYDWFQFSWLEKAGITEPTTRPVIIANSILASDGTQLVRKGSGQTLGDAPMDKSGNAPAGHIE
jgi:hypothetical protein